MAILEQVALRQPHRANDRRVLRPHPPLIGPTSTSRSSTSRITHWTRSVCAGSARSAHMRRRCGRRQCDLPRHTAGGCGTYRSRRAADGGALMDTGDSRDITLHVNEIPYQVSVDVRATLLDLLRERLGLTGTKKGCDPRFGAGRAPSPSTGSGSSAAWRWRVSVDGASVTTIEGLSTGDDLEPVQQAFLDHDAFQCGYCSRARSRRRTRCCTNTPAGTCPRRPSTATGSRPRRGARPSPRTRSGNAWQATSVVAARYSNMSMPSPRWLRTGVKTFAFGHARRWTTRSVRLGQRRVYLAGGTNWST